MSIGNHLQDRVRKFIDRLLYARKISPVLESQWYHCELTLELSVVAGDDADETWTRLTRTETEQSKEKDRSFPWLLNTNTLEFMTAFRQFKAEMEQEELACQRVLTAPSSTFVASPSLAPLPPIESATHHSISDDTRWLLDRETPADPRRRQGNVHGARGEADVDDEWHAREITSTLCKRWPWHCDIELLVNKHSRIHKRNGLVRNVPVESDADDDVEQEDDGERPSVGDDDADEDDAAGDDTKTVFTLPPCSMSLIRAAAKKTIEITSIVHHCLVMEPILSTTSTESIQESKLSSSPGGGALAMSGAAVTSYYRVALVEKRRFTRFRELPPPSSRSLVHATFKHAYSPQEREDSKQGGRTHAGSIIPDKSSDEDRLEHDKEWFPQRIASYRQQRDPAICVDVWFLKDGMYDHFKDGNSAAGTTSAKCMGKRFSEPPPPVITSQGHRKYGMQLRYSVGLLTPQQPSSSSSLTVHAPVVLSGDAKRVLNPNFIQHWIHTIVRPLLLVSRHRHMSPSASGITVASSSHHHHPHPHHSTDGNLHHVVDSLTSKQITDKYAMDGLFPQEVDRLHCTELAFVFMESYRRRLQSDAHRLHGRRPRASRLHLMRGHAAGVAMIGREDDEAYTKEMANDGDNGEGEDADDDDKSKEHGAEEKPSHGLVTRMLHVPIQEYKFVELECRIGTWSMTSGKFTSGIDVDTFDRIASRLIASTGRKSVVLPHEWRVECQYLYAGGFRLTCKDGADAKQTLHGETLQRIRHLDYVLCKAGTFHDMNEHRIRLPDAKQAPMKAVPPMHTVRFVIKDERQTEIETMKIQHSVTLGRPLHCMLKSVLDIYSDGTRFWMSDTPGVDTDTASILPLHPELRDAAGTTNRQHDADRADDERDSHEESSSTGAASGSVDASHNHKRQKIRLSTTTTSTMHSATKTGSLSTISSPAAVPAPAVPLYKWSLICRSEHGASPKQVCDDLVKGQSCISREIELEVLPARAVLPGATPDELVMSLARQMRDALHGSSPSSAAGIHRQRFEFISTHQWRRYVREHLHHHHSAGE